MKKFAIAPLLTVAVLLLLANGKMPHCSATPPKSVISQVTNACPSDTPRMKQYWFVQLLTGPNQIPDKATSNRIQAAHLANIGRLHSEGKLVMAGPMGYKYKNDWRGIFILDAPDSATAASYINTDSAVITGRLRFEIHPWWTQTGTYTFK